MPAIETVLVDKVLADATLSGLIGDRFFAANIPADADLPAASYTRISTVRLGHLNGFSELTDVRIQITITAERMQTANEIADAFLSLLHYHRDVGTSPPWYVSINQNQMMNFFDANDLRTIRQDYFIKHRETL